MPISDVQGLCGYRPVFPVYLRASRKSNLEDSSEGCLCSPGPRLMRHVRHCGPLSFMTSSSSGLLSMMWISAPSGDRSKTTPAFIPSLPVKNTLLKYVHSPELFTLYFCHASSPNDKRCVEKPRSFAISKKGTTSGNTYFRRSEKASFNTTFISSSGILPPVRRDISAACFSSVYPLCQTASYARLHTSSPMPRCKKAF